MMRFGRNSEARKVWYRKRKTPKCHFRFCGTVNNEGHSFRKGVPFKWSKSKPICGISVVKREIAAVFTAAISIFGGPEEDRTPEPFGCEPNALPNATQHGPHSFGQARLFASFTWARVLRGILRGCEPLGGSLRMIRILAPNE